MAAVAGMAGARPRGNMDFQLEVGRATELNRHHAKLVDHTQLISSPSACPVIPMKTLAGKATRAVWEATNAALIAADQAYAVQLSIRDANCCSFLDELVTDPNLITRCT